MYQTPDQEFLFALVITVSVFLFVLVVLFIVLYNYVQSRKRTSIEILTAVFRSQEIDRDKMSMELHDEIGSKLSIIKLTNEFLVAKTQGSELCQYAEKTSNLIDDLTALTRYIARDYASSLVVANGLRSELDKLISDCKQVHAINFHLKYKVDAVELSDDFTINMYRVIQELVNNSLKHSKCKNITISLYLQQDDLVLLYNDDGEGLKQNQNSAGMGMRNIMGRVIANKGQLSIRNEAGLTFIMQFKLQDILKHRESTNS